jgi:hypothetical protein
VDGDDRPALHRALGVRARVLTDPDVVRRIMAHLKHPTHPPPPILARRAGTVPAFSLEEEKSLLSEGAEQTIEPGGGEGLEGPPP